MFVRCVSVCVYSGPVSQTSLKWELNANSSKTVKATDFKLDKHVPRDSGRDALIFWKGGVCKNSLGGDMHSHERLLVYILSL